MEKYSRKKVLSGFIWKFGERILALGTTFIITVCLSRILSPDEYGLVALALVVISLADVFVVAGFGNALIQKKDADETDFSSVFYFNFIFSMFIYLLIFLIAPLLADFFEYSELTLVVRVLGIRVPIAAINSVQQAYVSRHMDFKRFFWSAFWGTILSGIIGIAMALKGFGVWALVAQYLSNTCIDTLVLWFTVKWRPIRVFDFVRVRDMFSYGWKLMVSGFIDTGYNQIRNLLIGKIYTSKDLAYFTNGNQFPQAAISAINTSISAVLFPTMSQEQEDLQTVKNMTRQAIRVSSYILWPVMLGFAAVAPSFVSAFLTDKWLPCVPYIQIACVAYGFWPIHTANLEALKATGNSGMFLKLEIIKCAVGFALLFSVMKLGVMAIALSMIASSVISCFINSAPNVRILNYTFFEQLCDIIPSIIKSLIMAFCVYLAGNIIKVKMVSLLVQILLGAVLYIVISVVTRDKSFLYVINLLRREKGAGK